MRVNFGEKRIWAAFMVAAIGTLLALSVFSAPQASAHDDPPGCSDNGVGLSISLFRADGTTAVGGGTVQSGELIKYRATLFNLGGENCNFEGGTLVITTPDGVPHDVTPVGGIPLVVFGSPFVSAFVDYTVSESDVSGGRIEADADYSDGIAHLGEAEQTAAAHVDRQTPYLDVSLRVSKDAIPSFNREFEWDIEKTVTPDVHNLFTGDSADSEYTVTLTKGAAVDSDYAVTGTITITNPAAFASATIESVTDVITGVGAATVDCGDAFPILLAPGGVLECSYSSDLPDDATRTNTATATTSGDVDGDSGDASIDFTGVEPTEVLNDTVNVDDTNGLSWSFSDSGSVSYTRTFTCDEDEGTHDNTATIVETGQSDDASVTVNCYDLETRKTAETSLERRWTWDIEKSADQTHLELDEGDSATVNYEVTVSAVSSDGAWHVEGIITIANNHPTQDAELTSVNDLVSPAIAADVVCPSLTVPAGGSLVCTYTADLPDGNTRLNTATASQQNFHYDAAGAGTPSGTTDYSGSASVDFAGASVDEIDECVDVSDTNVGPLGTVCAADAPETFVYSLTFGTADTNDVVLECGENTHPNTASFVTNDTGTTGSDDETVTATVTCEVFAGCTPGFWKNHPAVWQGYSPNQTLESVFDVPNGLGLDNVTLFQALGFGGGSGVKGASQILLRAAVAALLNSAHDNIDYPWTTAEVIAAVNAALASNNRATILALAADLDEDNNLGCSIDAHGNVIDH